MKQIKINLVCAIIGAMSVLTCRSVQDDDLVKLFSDASYEKVRLAWKNQRYFPADVKQIDVEISNSFHEIARVSMFTKKNVTFKSKVTDPAICDAIARKLHGARGPSFGTYYWSGPPDTKLGTITFTTKSDDSTLVITVGSGGFYLGEEFDPRLKFHSWYLAKILNDCAVKRKTSLTQRAFNSLSGVSWIVRDQYSLSTFDKKTYQERAANVWNFLPEEIVKMQQEQGVKQDNSKGPGALKVEQ